MFNRTKKLTYNANWFVRSHIGFLGGTPLYKYVVSLALFLFLLTSTALAQTTYYPARGVFNGFFSQINIVECDNNNSVPVNMTLNATSSAGVLVGARNFTMPAFGSVHTILNDLGNIVNNHGTYSLEIAASQELLGDRVNCRTAFYRPSSTGIKQFEYAYVLPVQNPQLGSISGIYNSIEPAAGGSTLNWLSVINFDDEPFNATVKIYRADGTLGSEQPISSLAPGQRVDIPLGHPEGQVTGLYLVEPVDQSQFYDAFVIRYNTKRNGGFNFAFPLRGMGGSCAGDPVQASTMGNGLTENWLEIANLNGTEVGTINVTIEVRDRLGALLHQEVRAIPPFGQSHLYLSSIIDPARTGNVGSARVICDDPSDKLIVQSTFYGIAPGNDQIEWSYSTQARGAGFVTDQSQLSVPVNTFVGMANWLKLADSSISPSVASFTLYNQIGQTVAAGDQGITAGGTADIGYHSMLGADGVGSVVMNTDTETAAFSGEMLRVLSRTDGQIANIISIPGIVQQTGVDSSFRGDPQSLAPYRETITKSEAHHLYTRAAFGGTPTQVSNAKQNGLQSTVNSLLTITSNPTLQQKAINWLDGDEEADDPDNINYQLYGIRRFWLHHIKNTKNPLKEKMAFIWHDLLAASCRVIDSSSQRVRCYEHLQLLRSNALGNFKTLMKEMTIDYLMLVWLNGNVNKAEEPDENYAREHWELFSMGERSVHPGRFNLYTEADIAEAARAFTGWTTQTIDGIAQRVFVQDLHDRGTKTLFADTPYEVSGTFNHEDVTDITLNSRPEAAQFIARRLFTAFIHDHPTPSVINQLAGLIRANNWNIKPVLRVLLQSEALFSTDARNSRVKDPITFAVGFLKSTGIPMTTSRLETELRDMGLVLMDPPDVNGWPINKPGKANKSEYFLAWAPQFANFVTEALRRMNEGLPSGESHDLATLLPHSRANSEETVDHIASLLNVRLTNSQRNKCIEYMDNDLNSDNSIDPELFDPRDPSHVRQKISGLVWILSQHENYLTF